MVSHQISYPTNSHPEKINEKDKEINYTLDYRGIVFRMKARDYELVEEIFDINVNIFGYENRVFPLNLSKKSNQQVLNELLINDYIFIKDFVRLMLSRTKYKDRKYFCVSCL